MRPAGDFSNKRKKWTVYYKNFRPPKMWKYAENDIEEKGSFAEIFVAN
jgi:hypothetical protein